MNQTEQHQKTKKICPECGSFVHEHRESHFMECEQCLSKREE
ncbi:YhfH family protein [Massilibacterium senegalense]|nr:YhfH family protein [Massilibacterium senegalense]